MNPLIFFRVIRLALGMVVMLYRQALWLVLSLLRVPPRVHIPVGAGAAVVLFWAPFLPLLFGTDAPTLVRVGAVLAVVLGAYVSAARWSSRLVRR